MYHYLKWAALSFFVKRNLRYLVAILLALGGIYGSDAIYQDMKDYALATDQKELVIYFLIGKWVLILLLAGMFLYSVMQLGFGRNGTVDKKSRRKPEGTDKPQSRDFEDDPIMKRLEKFRTRRDLKRRSDLILEKRKKR
jgi:hypothetical protein